MLNDIERIWVIGASTGIGKALVTALAKFDKSIIASARSRDKLDALCGLTPSKCQPHTLDITDDSACQAAVKKLQSTYPSIDMVVVNAGTCEYIDSDEIDMNSIKRVMDTNFTAAVSTINAALPLLRESAKQGKRPKLVVMSSSVTYQALPRAHVYGASKAALRYFSECLKIDLQQEGIDVHLVSPGFVKTPLTDLNDFPMPLLMEPEEAASRIISGLERGIFDIHFPQRFTRTLKLISLLPDRLRFSLLAKLSRNASHTGSSTRTAHSIATTSPQDRQQ